jgi:hypothetical protein
MTDSERQRDRERAKQADIIARLRAERDAILERIQAVAEQPVELEMLERQFGERLSHLKFRIGDSP